MRSIRTAFFGLLFLLAVLYNTTAAPLHEDPMQAKFQRVIEWVRELGGLVRAEIRSDPSKGGRRGLYATEYIQKGEFAISIPASTFINLSGDETIFTEATMTMLRELKLGNHSRFWTYLQTLPGPSDVLHSCNFDPYYLPMLKSDTLADGALLLQSTLERLLHGDMSELQEEPVILQEAVGDANVTLDELKYACALPNSRCIGGRNRVLLVPVHDMTNHRHDCPNQVDLYSDRVGPRLVIEAGQDIQPGEEICTHYGIYHDDYAVMNYGFLPPQESTPPHLMRVDERDTPLPDGSDGITATQQEIEDEVARLQGILEDMDSRPDTVKPRTSHGGSDYVWDMLKELERRRRAALLFEIDRVTALGDQQLEGAEEALGGQPEQHQVEEDHVEL